MWIFGALLSAILLGVYDIFKKISLKENAVLPVLLLSTLAGAFLLSPLVLLSKFHFFNQNSPGFIPPQTFNAHIHFFIKSIIVSSSWVLAYFAMKHLPITIVSPIRSSGPLWTLLGAIVLFSEALNFVQWIGLILTIGFYYLFSLSGKREGLSFRKNKWILYMVLSTIIGSISSLYDKYLVAHFDRMAMQCWFSIYMVPISLAMFLFVWYPNRKKYTPFQWRPAILLIGITLAFADFIYFWAISQENSLISIISTLRRGSVIISFSLGAFLFKEQNIKIKALILAGILTGIGFIVLGS